MGSHENSHIHQTGWDPGAGDHSEVQCDMNKNQAFGI